MFQEFLMQDLAEKVVSGILNGGGLGGFGGEGGGTYVWLVRMVF